MRKLLSKFAFELTVSWNFFFSLVMSCLHSINLIYIPHPNCSVCVYVCLTLSRQNESKVHSISMYVYILSADILKISMWQIGCDAKRCVGMPYARPKYPDNFFFGIGSRMRSGLIPSVAQTVFKCTDRNGIKKTAKKKVKVEERTNEPSNKKECF